MRPTLLLITLLAFVCQANANIIYVQQHGTGSGTSWSDAMGDLNAAIKMAESGDQVWVAKGTYKPTATQDRSITFNIPDGVAVLGGFSGSESSAEARNPAQYTTVLSGEIGAPGIMDNSYTIVMFDKVSENTVLDGFTILAGNANSEMEEGNATRCGGAIYINGEGGSAKPVIMNCVVTKNHGRDGAAVYNNGRNGESSPVFVNCSFTFNEAGLDGGAIYNDGRMNGKSEPRFTDCTFERNMGTYGGAICNATEFGVCNLILQNCIFKENAAYLRGGAVFSLNGDQKCFLDISDCQFQDNFPDDQNMIFTSNTARNNAYQIRKSEP